MKISAIPKTYNIPVFKSSYRQVEDFTKPECSSERVVHRNTTYFFRDDIDWNELSKYVSNKYNNTDKVHTYCYACSDGSEPYSFVMKLLTDLGNDRAEKFLPVIAKDYDKFIIDKAKSKKVMMICYEPEIIEKQIKGSINKYMEYMGERNVSCRKEYIYHVKPNLSDNVEFEQANIVDDICNIEPENSIVFCRNFWPYMRDTEKINNLAIQLYNRLGNNSCVLLGGYDEMDMRVFRAMKNAGFELVDRDSRIFEKKEHAKLNAIV